MKETYIEIPSSDKDIKIHGTLRGSLNMPVAILAPGLGGWMYDLQMFNASRYFEDSGYSTLRLSFYGHKTNQRNISNYAVHDCAKDIDAVVGYLRKQKVKFIAVVGHSYSGLGIMYSENQQFDTGILWDPTHTDGYEEPESQKNLERDFQYIESLKSYVSGEGPGYVLSERVFKEYGPGSAIAAKKFRRPLLVINASDTDYQIERGKDYVDNCPVQSKQVIIPRSSHPFTEDGAMEKLFEETIKWMDKLKKKLK